MEQVIDKLFVGIPYNLRLPAEMAHNDTPAAVRFELLAEKLMTVDWGWRMDIHKVDHRPRVDLAELVKDQIRYKRRGINISRDSGINDLSVHIRNGIGMVRYPYGTVRMQGSGPETEADQYCYLPRDCDTLVIHSGRACFALITTSLEPQPDVPRLQILTIFENM